MKNASLKPSETSGNLLLSTMKGEDWQEIEWVAERWPMHWHNNETRKNKESGRVNDLQIFLCETLRVLHYKKATTRAEC